MEEVLVFIDEGFLSKVSKHFGDGNYFKIDYLKFAKLVSGKLGLSCKHIFYYTAPPFQSDKPSRDQIKRKRGYDKFIEAIGRNREITVREGRCQKIGSEYHQKGVDALMVFDMASVPIKFPNVKKIIMVTSDTDFCPIVDKVEDLGVNVLLCTYYEKKRGSQFSVSHHLIDCCKDVYYLTKDDFENARLMK